MSYASLLYKIPEELRRLYRKYEAYCKKEVNNEWSKKFNEICLQEDILPNYSRIQLRDPAVSNQSKNLNYRRYLVKKEIEDKEKQKYQLEQQRNNIRETIDSFTCSNEKKLSIDKALSDIISNYYNVVKVRTVKKLNTLYHGKIVTNNDKSICIKEKVDSFVNLSDHQLSQVEIEFLNLGLNCHLQPRYDKLQKQTELEILYQSVLKLEEQGKVTVNQNLVDQLKNEGTKNRYKKQNSILTPQLKRAATSLKNNEHIIVRKADKSSMYVILNKDDYLQKIDTILADTTKFKCIQKDPSKELKHKANQLIDCQNAIVGDIKLNKIVGDYEPGYIYGNIKTHKPGNPIRPIISQIPTPTYKLAKTINEIISPYIPNEYLLRSSNDFVDLLQSNIPQGIIASLDVESLFTNVPIDETIEIILKNVYKHPDIPPPKMSPQVLKNFLQLCTKEAPFRCPRNKMYVQIEGVAMGSPLGPTFANFYMGELEARIFEDKNNKPLIYARYVDDIFLQIEDETQLIHLRNTFRDNSVLNFTYELSANSKLPFLDVLVEPVNNKFRTSVYHKKTDNGSCLNGKSECVDKYKDSVITNYLTRAYKISDSWNTFHREIKHIKQVLVNNNYSNRTVDQHIKKFLERKVIEEQTRDNSQIIRIFYQNQTHANCKLDEKILNNIVQSNVKCTEENKKLRIIFYYKNQKTHSLIMKNNLSPKRPPLQQSNVVYKFVCPAPHSKAEEYIGFTQTTLSRRLTMHAQNGSILKHFRSEHGCAPSREQLIENTQIITRAADRYKLTIKEALLILKESPSLNIQFENFTNILKLYSHRSLQPSVRNHKTLAESDNSQQNCTEVINSSPLALTNNSHKDTTPGSRVQYDEESLPDFEIVLSNFGVNCSKFTPIPLEDYQKLYLEEPEAMTISQRIKTLVRRARQTNTLTVS